MQPVAPTPAVAAPYAAAPYAPVAGAPSSEPMVRAEIRAGDAPASRGRPPLKLGVGLRSGLAFWPNDKVKPHAGSRYANRLSTPSLALHEVNVRSYLSVKLNDAFGFAASFHILHDLNDLGSLNYADPRGLIGVHPGGTGEPSAARSCFGKTTCFDLLDAVGKFGPAEYFNIWVGQFQQPTTRANLSGLYYQNQWNLPFPIGLHGFPSDFFGRDRQIVVWGTAGGGQFKYAAGALDLDGRKSKNLRWAGRLVLNLLDPEPGYGNRSTYYGEKDILSIGVAGQYQKGWRDRATNAIHATDELKGFAADVLFEKNLSGNGVLTLETGYYHFGSTDPGYLPNGFAGRGQSFYAAGSYLLPTKLGSGQLQPSFRYMIQDKDSLQTSSGGLGRDPKPLHTIEIGLGYIMWGHDGRAHLLYLHQQQDDRSADALVVGLQIQGFSGGGDG
ncbi:MAG: hypothetical protein MJD61_02510 [Proteobacteria bacterium]|nr:hypothetical protein [Pseudomonadota bacterium]